jgi:SAM-dependent methyltransferase
VRSRGIVFLLSLAIYGRPISLPAFRVDKDIVGAGLSDWSGYADRLAEKFSYRTTFFHTQPRLDIAAPPAELHGSLHFLIASDVFEHVPPPVSRAFEGAFALLRPGGHLIFSVPYNGGDAPTIEHYPEMQDFTVASIGDRHCVVVLQRDGSMTLDVNPVFHGGPGQTLEMRVFGERDLLMLLRRAGFVDVRVLSQPAPEFGIHFFDGNWSLPISARKPA